MYTAGQIVAAFIIGVGSVILFFLGVATLVVIGIVIYRAYQQSTK